MNRATTNHHHLSLSLSPSHFLTVSGRVDQEELSFEAVEVKRLRASRLLGDSAHALTHIATKRRSECQ